jgi:SAM-dependent methyltransferase
MLNPLVTNLRQLEVTKIIHPKDTMFGHGFEWHYFNVGRSALTAVATVLCARLNYHGGSSEIQTILDFGSGYGRVARYLRAAFPKARIVVDDFDKEGPAFCATEFGCEIVDDCLTPDTYDLVWLGSVFTHLPESAVADLLVKLKRTMRVNGVLVFTSQGRYSALQIEQYLKKKSEEQPKRPPYNLSSDTLLDLITGYYKGGFGFVSYPGQNGYGIAITSPGWFQRQICAEDILQIAWQEKGWDAHQDVNAFIRADVNDARKSNF